MSLDILLNRRDELRDAAEDPTPNPLVCHLTEETFHKVEPRTAGWGEMHMETAMAREPPLDLRMLVGGIIIRDQVQGFVLGDLLVEQPQKRQPFLVAMARQARGDDGALGDIQRGKQGGGPMPFIIMGHRATAAFLEG